MYTIERVEIHDEHAASAIRQLILISFPRQVYLAPGHIAANMDSRASQPCFFLVAKTQGQIIGCNGFMAYDFEFNGMPVVGYQSCWTATHPEHRGKGIFQALINEAKKILEDAGAGFIYGMANQLSLPIMTGTLGFDEIPCQVARLKRIPFLPADKFRNGKMDKSNSLTVNEQQVLDHKGRQFPAQVFSFAHAGSRIWGKLVSKRKWGIMISVFYVGGIELTDVQDLPCLIAEIYQSTGVRIVQLISCKTNRFNELVRGWRQTDKIRGFVFYNLGIPAIENLDLMIGSIDVF